MAKGKKKVESSESDASDTSESTSAETTSSSSSEESASSSSSSEKKSKSKKSAKASPKKKSSKSAKKGKGKKDGKKTKRKGKKAKKDPNAPKRATTAYFYYTSQRRSELLKEQPGIKVTEQAKIMGQEWKQLSDSEKAPFVQKAEKDKKRYAEEKANYVAPEKDSDASDSSSDSDEPKKKKKKKDPNAPKKPKNAFMFFANDKRESVKAKHPKFKTTEISTKLGEMWKSLSEAEKKPYEKQAENDKGRYEKEMKAYNA